MYCVCHTVSSVMRETEAEDRVPLQHIAGTLTYWKALWPVIVFILATGSRLVQYLLHARSWIIIWQKQSRLS